MQYRLGLRAGDAASVGWQVTLYDPIRHAGSCAILIYLYVLPNPNAVVAISNTSLQHNMSVLS